MVGRKRARKRNAVGGAIYGVGVVLLEAAALGALVWLIAVRAQRGDQHDHPQKPPTLAIQATQRASDWSSPP